MSKAFSTESAAKWFFAGVGSDVDVDRVAILEPLVAQVAVVEETRFFSRFVGRGSVGGSR